MNKNLFQKTLYYHEIRQSLFILIFQISGVQIIAAIIDFFLIKLSFVFGLHDVYMSSWEFILSHLFNTVWLLWVIIKWASTYYVINYKEISITKGVIRKKKCSYDIRGIQSSSVTQGLLGRIFNYGTIHLENPLLKSDVFLKNIYSPNSYINIIEQAHKNAVKTSPLTDVMLNLKTHV
jgi:uncharacterized membrane protein YdbT with pleckstrin-like domain